MSKGDKRWKFPLLCRCTCGCDATLMGESWWIYLRLFDSLNLPCTNQGYVAATFPTYVTSVRWVGIDFDAPCRWACAHVTGTESVHSTIFTHELRWCASELIRLKTMAVAENVARFQRDRKTLKGWKLRKQWKIVPGSSKQIAVYQAWHPPAFTQCTKTLCQYISTDYQHA